MNKSFVLVTATLSLKSGSCRTSRGLKVIERAEDFESFVESFLRDRGVKDAEILVRDTHTLAKLYVDEDLCQWVFTPYERFQLFEAVAHLTKEELLRDIGAILPLLGKQ